MAKTPAPTHPRPKGAHRKRAARGIRIAEMRQSGKPRNRNGNGPWPDPLRLARVEELLGQGLRPLHIERIVCEEFGVSGRCVRYDVNRVRAFLAPDAEVDRKARIARIDADLTDIRAFALYDGDLELARKTLADERRLFGLDAPAKVEHSGGLSNVQIALPPAMSNDEYMAFVAAALQPKAAETPAPAPPPAPEPTGNE